MSLFWRRFFFIFGTLFISLNLVLLITHRLYLYTAIWYNYADIDDDKIFYQDTVASSHGKPWPESTLYNKSVLNKELSSDLIKYKTVAFLAFHNDSILHEMYWDEYSKDSRSNSFSVAKSIVSILVGIAIDEGKIASIDDPVITYLPQFDDSLGAQLTIRHLLNMSAGFNFEETYSGLFSMTTRAYYDDELSRLLKDLKLIEMPGIRFHYQSCNQILLTAILEKATQKRLATYASEKLWKPLGATQDATWSLDHEGGSPKAFCCWYSTARDLAKVGQLMLHHGKMDGKQIVSEKWVQQSLTLAALNEEEGNGKIDFYGLSWWFGSYKGSPYFYGRGMDGQYLICVPNYQLIIVRYGQERNPERQGEHMKEVSNFIGGIIDSYQLKSNLNN